MRHKLFLRVSKYKLEMKKKGVKKLNYKEKYQFANIRYKEKKVNFK